MKSWTDTTVGKPDCEFPDWMWTWLNLQVAQVESICHSFHAIPLNTSLLLTIQVCPFMFASSRGCCNLDFANKQLHIIFLITVVFYQTPQNIWLIDNGVCKTMHPVASSLSRQSKGGSMAAMDSTTMYEDDYAGCSKKDGMNWPMAPMALKFCDDFDD